MKKIFLAASVMASIALSTAPAIAEEKVTVYTAVPQIFIDELVPMFEKKTGVDVEIIKAGSGELLNRLTAEAARPMADVLWSVDSSVVDFNPTLFEAYAPAGTDALLEGISDSEKASPFSAVVMAFIVNESKLDGLPIPQSWLELSDPKYDDYISSAKANRSALRTFNSQLFFRVMVKKEVGRFTKDCWQTMSYLTVLVPYLVS